MLKKAVMALLASASLTFSAGAQPAAEPPLVPKVVAPSLFDTLLPPGTSIELKGREDTTTSSRAAGAVLRGSTVEIGIVGLSMRALEDGGYLLTLDRATVMPKIHSAPRLSVTGLAMVLEQPAAGDDTLCSWLDAVASATISALQIDRSLGEADWISVIGQAVEYRSAGQGGCSLGGTLTAREITARQPDQRIHSISDVGIVAWLPGSAEATTTLQGPAHLKINVGEIEISRAGEIPSLGASGTEFAMDADMHSLATPAALVRAANPFRYVWPGSALAMQAYNASLRAAADFRFSAQAIRIYSAGVMPAPLIRNFGRAGLSTITGDLTGELALRKGVGRLKQSLVLTGIGTQKLLMEFDANPYPAEKVELAMDAIDLGLHAVPDIGILRAEIEVDDEGFAGAMREVTGMPLTSNITAPSLLKLIAPTSSEGTISGVAARLRDFANRVVSGKPVQIDVIPKERTSILQLANQLLLDPLQLPVYLSSVDIES